MQPLLSLVGITKRYPGVIAVDDASIFVASGEIVGLLGENGAGKSTIVKVVAGLVKPDAGSVTVAGHTGAIRSAAEAKSAGIGLVHQHFMLVPTMTVAENVALGNQVGGTSRAAIIGKIRELSSRYRLDVDPSALVADLSVGARQRVEIIRMLYSEPKVLILDEPTAVLTPSEWVELATVMRQLAAEGRGLLFITHKLDELLEVAGRCVVMRGGVVVESFDVADVTKSVLARAMIGRDLKPSMDRVRRDSGDVVLEVDGLSWLDGSGDTRVDDVSFTIREGEVLGIAGVDGNGQGELVELLTGLSAPSSGEICLLKTQVEGLSPAQFIKLGGAVVHADRHEWSVADELAVEDNLMLVEGQQPPYVVLGLRRRRIARARCLEMMIEYDVRAVSPDVLVQQLSGGNQQKVVLARELGRAPKLLIAEQPTRGLDVSAVEFVYERIDRHRQAGGATLLVSTELDEIFALSDRIAVISDGQIVAEFDPADATPESLGLLMAGSRSAA